MGLSSFFEVWLREGARRRLRAFREDPEAYAEVRRRLDELKSDPYVGDERPAREGGGRRIRVPLDNPGTVEIRYLVLSGSREVEIRMIETTLERDRRRQRRARERFRRGDR